MTMELLKPLYPSVHIHGATGARAAVLIKHRNARAKRTNEQGPHFPIYAVLAGKLELGRGDGVSDAWEQTARNLYK
jgi:hypothetical protein